MNREQRFDKQNLPSADAVWNSMADAVNSAYQSEVADGVVARTLQRNEVGQVADLPDKIRFGLVRHLWNGPEREERFVKGVVTALLLTMEQKPDATEYDVLFDVDETLAHRTWKGIPAHIVRPSAAPLLAALRAIDPRVRLGLVSDRSQAYLDQELAAPNELAPIVPYLDTARVVSSNEVPDDGSVSKYMDASQADMYSVGVRQKLLICECLLKETPGASVMLVEDEPLFKELLSDERFRTVVLDKTSSFELYG